MAYDELALDTLGDKKTALFLIMSDTDTTFNFVLAMLQSQLLNLLCDRIDGERFYSRLRMFSLEDGRKQLADYQRRSNRIWKPCLGMKSPNQVVEQYLGAM